MLGQRRLQAARAMFEVFESILDELRNRTDTPYYVQANIMEVHEAGSSCDGEGGRERRESIPPTQDLFPEVEASAAGGGTCRPFELCRTQWISSCENYRTCQAGRESLFVITSDHGETLPGDHPSLSRSKVARLARLRVTGAGALDHV